MPRDTAGGDEGPCVVLFLYAIVIMMSGAIANSSSASAAADAPYPTSAGPVYVGNGFAMLTFAAAIASRRHGSVRKGDAGFLEYMIGIHVGLLLPALASVACVVAAVWAWGAENSRHLVPYLVLDAVVSAVALGLLVQYRPKKAELAPVQPPLPKPVARTAADATASSKAAKTRKASKGGNTRAKAH
jgi:hypothetical protein